MTFYTLQNAPLAWSDVVFREARASKAILATVLAIGLGPLARFAWLRRIDTCPLLALGGTILLFFLLVASALRKASGPEGWAVRLTKQGLLVKYRSYQNAHFADDEVAIVLFHPDDLEWIGATRERILSPDSDGNGARATAHRCLDLRLRDGVDITALEQRLAAERAHPAVGGWMKSRTNHYPVRLVDGRTLRIEWSGGSNLTPSLPKALAALAGVAPVRAEERRIVYDLASPAADRTANDAKILELINRGEMAAAIKLVRRTYGWSLVEAKTFVDDLTAGDNRS